MVPPACVPRSGKWPIGAVQREGDRPTPRYRRVQNACVIGSPRPRSSTKPGRRFWAVPRRRWLKFSGDLTDFELTEPRYTEVVAASPFMPGAPGLCTAVGRAATMEQFNAQATTRHRGTGERPRPTRPRTVYRGQVSGHYGAVQRTGDPPTPRYRRVQNTCVIGSPRPGSSTKPGRRFWAVPRRRWLKLSGEPHHPRTHRTAVNRDSPRLAFHAGRPGTVYRGQVSGHSGEFSAQATARHRGTGERARPTRPGTVYRGQVSGHYGAVQRTGDRPTPRYRRASATNPPQDCVPR